MTVEPAAPRADRAAVAWIVIGCMVATYCALWALATVWAWDRTDGDFQPFTDAITYLAAGERLNAGHDLYRLVPGDRQVLIIEGIFSAPLVSPPPIAVLWRPLAALGFGQSLWIVACWTVLLATVVYVVARGRWVGVALALVLAPSVADQLAAANVASFFPALLIIAWRLGDSVWTGASLAAMAALKLSPIAMVAWLVGIRARRAIAAWLVAFTVLIIIGALGAGITSYLDYFDVARSVAPSPLSLSARSGIPWLSYAVLFSGMALSVLTGRRRSLSFVLAVSASVFGTPALYPSGFVPLLALAAPFLDVPTTWVEPVATIRAYGRALWQTSPT